ncbi:MAG: DUF5076 domain-containing protein [Granulosicoccus sp.]
MKELATTENIKEHADAMELLRVWHVNGNQEFIIATQVWEDPAAWGLLLADLARQIANTYGGNTVYENRQQVLQRLKEGFDVEWENPT